MAKLAGQFSDGHTVFDPSECMIPDELAKTVAVVSCCPLGR